MTNSSIPSDPSKSGWPIVALAASLWGTDLLIRPNLLKVGLSPTMIVLAEHVVLTILFLPVLIRGSSRIRSLSWQDWLGLLFIAWAGSSIATSLLTAAYQAGSPLTATLLQKTQPLFAVALAGIVLGEKRSAWFWLFFAGACGAAYLLSFGFMSPVVALQSPESIGSLYALGAAALWGACTVVGRMVLKDVDAPLVAGLRFTLAVPLLLVLVGSHGYNGSLALLSHPNAYVPLALIVLVPDVLGMTLYYSGLGRTPASVATVAELAYPVAALVLGMIVTAQRLSAGQWTGFALLILCLQAIQSTRSVRQSSIKDIPLQANASPAPVQET